jgi:isopenicillin N synthase-like dioxygenase
MPTIGLFDQHPPFPKEVPTADVPHLSLGKLLSDDNSVESELLFKACRNYGFFLLNLQGSPEGEALLRDAEAMFELNRELHDLDLEEKMKYAYSPPTQLFG